MVLFGGGEIYFRIGGGFVESTDFFSVGKMR
jgi:hypothetical protein